MRWPCIGAHQQCWKPSEHSEMLSQAAEMSFLSKFATGLHKGRQLPVLSPWFSLLFQPMMAVNAVIWWILSPISRPPGKQQVVSRCKPQVLFNVLFYLQGADLAFVAFAGALRDAWAESLS